MKDSAQFSVLVVEDDLNDIFIIRRAFKKANLTNPLQIVTDGAEAMEYLQGRGKYADRQLYPLPQLIVTDIKMPRLSGFELLQWIKGETLLKRIPVIIVSASDQPSDIDLAYELGANAYMIKPMNYDSVVGLFQSITHYWGLECVCPQLAAAAG